MKRMLRTSLLTPLLFTLASAPDVLAYYDPGVQRWINRDPIEEDGGINLHEFAFNNPILKIDAFGESTPDDLDDPNSKNQLGKCDPCKGLRKQLKLHEEKYRQYLADPDSMDNLGILEGKSEWERNRIIAGRLRALLNQIRNSRKQLQECDEEHGHR